MQLKEFFKEYGDCEINDVLAEEILKSNGKLLKGWRPKEGDTYWYVFAGEVMDTTWEEDPTDLFLLEAHKIYSSQKEAKIALDMYNFCKDRSFEPDWKNENQTRYVLALDFHNHRVHGVSLALKYFAPFYYPTFEQVDEVMNKYSFEELEKYYGRV